MGLTGEFVSQSFMPYECDSCGEGNTHGYDIWADTELGELLGLEQDPIEYDVDPSSGEEFPIYDHVVICKECLEHLRAAQDEL